MEKINANSFLSNLIKLLNDNSECVGFVSYKYNVIRKSQYEGKKYLSDPNIKKWVGAKISWELDDVSLDITNCRNYCVSEFHCWGCDDSEWLCNSCKEILERELEPFQKSTSELAMQIIQMQTKIDMLEQQIKSVMTMIQHYEKKE